MLEEKNVDGFRWQVSLPLLANGVLMRQAAAALAVACAVPAVIIGGITASSGRAAFLPAALVVFAAAFGGFALLSVPVVFLFYGNRLRASYHIDDAGITMEMRNERARRANRLVVALALLSGKPATAATGAVAAAGETTAVRWEDVTAVRHRRRDSTIFLRRRWRTVMWVFCDGQSYDGALAAVRAGAPRAEFEALP